MATKEQADLTLAAHVDQIMENPNVTAVSVIEEENGENVIEIALVSPEVQVDAGAEEAHSVRGLTPPVAPDELQIPDASGALTAGGATIPVRKRVVGKIFTQSFTDRRRPAAGGNSCGPATATWSGTLGGRVIKNGKDYYILSNWHVLYGGVGKDGDAVLQQARGDGGIYPADTVAYNSRGVLNDFLDAAIAEIRTPVDTYVAAGTRCYGAIAGLAFATVGMPVKKCGRSTEDTTGTVRSTNATVRVSDYPDGDHIFKDQIQMTAMSQKGDSGSIVIDQKSGKAVGLLFAGGASDTFANKIQLVINEFGVDFG